MRPAGIPNHDHAEKQDRILLAAARCFARDGFHGSSMKEICSAADMSPGSVYRYFESKESIIMAMIAADRRRWEQRLAEIPVNEGLIPALRRLAEIGLREIAQQGFLNLWVETLAEAARSPRVARSLRESYRAFERRLTDLVSESQRIGKTPASLRPVETARIILSSFDGLLLRLCFDEKIDIDATLSAFLGFLDVSICQASPPPSRPRRRRS
jgi:TetR/AcrR family transcriptional repressor of uid operon